MLPKQKESLATSGHSESGLCHSPRGISTSFTFPIRFVLLLRNRCDMLPKNILYCGTPELRPELIELKAGPLSMWFDPKTAFLKWLRLGDHEVVRGIYAAVRDENWATVLPELSNLQQEIKSDSFRLSFDVSCRKGHIDYFWRGRITGNAKGEVTYSFDG